MPVETITRILGHWRYFGTAIRGGGRNRGSVGPVTAPIGACGAGAVAHVSFQTWIFRPKSRGLAR